MTMKMMLMVMPIKVKTNPGSCLLSIRGELAQRVTMLTSAWITLIMMMVMMMMMMMMIMMAAFYHHPDLFHQPQYPFQLQKLYLELARSLISSPLDRGQQVSHHFRRLFERFPSTSSFARRTNGSRPTASICFKWPCPRERERENHHHHLWHCHHNHNRKWDEWGEADDANAAADDYDDDASDTGDDDVNNTDDADADAYADDDWCWWRCCHLVSWSSIRPHCSFLLTG